MNKKIKILLSVILALAMLLTCVGCGKNKDSKTYDDYSIGLDQNGFYENLDEHKKDISLKGISLKTNDILIWGNKRNNIDANAEQSLDEYLEAYAKEVLVAVGAADKEVAETGDIVTLQLDFYLEGKQLNEFYGENTFQVKEDSDSIVKSAIGHKIGDEYETKYTFDKTDADYPSKTADVKIKVIQIIYENPLQDELINNHLDKIQETVEGATDSKSLVSLLRPKLAEALLFDYLSDYIQNDESIKIPQEYIEHEVYRLKSRLAKVGYTYQDYLEASKTTDEDTYTQCEKFARENYAIMLYCKQNGLKTTDKSIDAYFSESKETAINVQGLAYMKLTVLREMALSQMMTEVTLLDDDGNKIEVEPLYDFSESNAEDTTSIESNKDTTSSESSSND